MPPITPLPIAAAKTSIVRSSISAFPAIGRCSVSRQSEESRRERSDARCKPTAKGIDGGAALVYWVAGNAREHRRPVLTGRAQLTRHPWLRQYKPVRDLPHQEWRHQPRPNSSIRKSRKLRTFGDWCGLFG